MENKILCCEGLVGEMNYLVSNKEQIDLIDSKLSLLPTGIRKHVQQVRWPSTNLLHVTMCHDHFNKEKTISLPLSLGLVKGIEAISTDKMKLVMGISLMLKDGTELFMLFEHLDLMLRVQFE